MRRAMTLLAVLPLCGCSVFLTKSQQSHDTNVRWKTGATYTGADVRIITERKHPVTGQTVICTEPAPDVAKAYADAFQAAANGSNGPNVRVRG